MIPHDILPRVIRLPDTDEHTIVILTGTSLRHLRFAYRIQQEFGNKVVAWYQVIPPGEASLPANGRRTSLFRKALNRVLPPERLQQVRDSVRKYGWWRTIRKSWSARRALSERLSCLYWLHRYQRRQAAAEKRLFSQEIEHLKSCARVEPRFVRDPSSEDFIRDVRTLNAYFLLTLGGPLYSQALLRSVRGVALNQHAGWSPNFKGSFTTEWALYHRDLNSVGSTVHMLTTGADAGPVLRRSHPCLTGADSPETCFLRVVALGTELMIECVREIMVKREMTVYESSETTGRTYRSSDLTGDVLRSIYRDFAEGWLPRALKKVRQF